MSTTNPLKGYAYRGSDGAVTCCLCDCEADWEECNQCAGDGGFDGYDEDPLWYHPGEIAPCPACNSRGGDYWCPNDSCESGELWRIFPTKERAMQCAKASKQPTAAGPAARDESNL